MVDWHQPNLSICTKCFFHLETLKNFVIMSFGHLTWIKMVTSTLRWVFIHDKYYKISFNNFNNYIFSMQFQYVLYYIIINTRQCCVVHWSSFLVTFSIIYILFFYSNIGCTAYTRIKHIRQLSVVVIFILINWPCKLWGTLPKMHMGKIVGK